MDGSELPRVNEVVAYLERFEPQLLNDLAASDPVLAEAVQTGVEGGKAKSLDEEELKHGLAVRGTILAAALSSVGGRGDAAIGRLNRLTAHARRFRLLAGVLAVLAASGVLIAAVFDMKAATIVAGLLSLGFNLLSIFTTRIVLGSDGREAEVIGLARRLGKASAGAELLKSLLRGMPKAGYDTAEMRSLLQQSNLIFREMNDALANAGVRPGLLLKSPASPPPSPR